MVRLISDFDGVIVDLSERYYQVYRWCLQQLDSPEELLHPLPKADFWALKRQRYPEQEIGRRSGLGEDQIVHFKQLRDHKAHQLDQMRHDRLITGSFEALKAARSQGWDVMTVTMRRRSELDKAFQLFPILEDLIPGDRRFCLVDHVYRNNDIDQKPILMGETLAQLAHDANTWIVGDTEADIRAAKIHNIPVISVLSGIRDRPTLEANEPNMIVENLWEAVVFIQENIRGED